MPACGRSGASDSRFGKGIDYRGDIVSLTTNPNWDKSKKRFEAWWHGEIEDRVLLQVTSRKTDVTAAPPPPPVPETPEEKWLSVDYRIAALEHHMGHVHYAGDAFPFLDTHIGPGTMSLYLGAIPGLMPTTVWYHRCIDDMTTAEVPAIDENNAYWLFSQELAKEGMKRLGGRALVSFPDLIEGLDTISSLVGNDELLLYLIDAPEHVHRFQEKLTDTYFHYHDRLYDTIKDEDGGSCFSAFNIYGRGRIAKVQCDFSAMIGPAMFEEFVIPYLAKQCARLDHSVFHLDGPCCLQHTDLLLGIKELEAIQWTPTVATEPPTHERWWPLYKRIRDAGKSVMILGGTPQQAKALVEEFGPEGFDIVLGAASEEEADAIVQDSYKWTKRRS